MSLQDVIINEDTMETYKVDEQLPKSHVHKTYPVEDERIYAFMCDCGAVFDEDGEQIQ